MPSGEDSSIRKPPYNISLYFLLFMIVLMTYLFLKVIWPFLFTILLGGIVTGLFYPLYKRLTKMLRGRESYASFVSCLIILLVIFLPLAGVLAVVTGQALEFYSKVDVYMHRVSFDTDQITNWLGVEEYLKKYEIDEAVLLEKVGELAKAASTFLVKSIQSVTQGAFNIIAMLFVMLFSMYYFFKDGPAFLDKFKKMSPLDDANEDRLIEKFASITRATIKGTMVIAIIQGCIGGIAFWIFGVSSPLFWGLIMAFLSIIPVVGSGLIWAPAAVIQLVLGNWIPGLGILAVGVVIISTVDNLLRPRLVGKDTELHPLLIFFGTLGGISVFGIFGFILGPIVAALFVTIWDIYASEFEI